MSATTSEYDQQVAFAVIELLAGGSSDPLPRHRHTLSRDDVRISQLSRILAAAINLFSTRGFAETTILQITTRAGVARKTFYEIVEGKEDVFLQTYRAVGFLLAQSGYSNGARQTPITPETIAPWVERGLAIFALAPEATKMFFLEAVGAGPRVRIRRNQAIDEFVAGIAPAMQQYRADLEPGLAPLTTRQCRVIVAAAIELIIEYLADHEPDRLTDLGPELAGLIHTFLAPNASPLTSP